MLRSIIAALGATLSVSLLVACGSDLDDIPAPRGKSNPAADAPVGTIVPTSEGEKVVTATGLPCDVDAVLRERCHICHSSPTKYGASAPLVTWDDLQKPGPGGSANKKVWELVKERIHDDARPMPQSPQPRLDAKELGVLDAWFASGAQSSDVKCLSAKPTNGVKPLSCKPDTVLKAKTPYELKPGGPQDETICFGVDLELAKKRHVIALAPKIDNAQVLHHILLLQSDIPVPSTPFACSTVGSAAWKLVAGWAPGGDNLELPKEAGIPAEQGSTHWVVQMHYNRGAVQSGTDNSGYELCTTEDLRPNDADVLAFGTLAVAIPPRATHSIQCNTALGVEYTGRHFYNASPHMHKLGAAMSIERVPLAGTGKPERFFEQKTFSFEAQVNSPADVDVAPGDVIRTRCTWKNPTDLPVVFGETTDSEMCFGFVGYYPKIPAYHWVAPSLAAACVPEP
jgi:hypothetical protein